MNIIDFRDPRHSTGVHLEPIEFVLNDTDKAIARIAKACLDKHVEALNEMDAKQDKS